MQGTRQLVLIKLVDKRRKRIFCLADLRLHIGIRAKYLGCLHECRAWLVLYSPQTIRPAQPFVHLQMKEAEMTQWHDIMT